jgi:hypothetical protein
MLIVWPEEQRLCVHRWKRVKDRMMDKRREYKELKVASEKLQTKENAIPDGSQAVPSSGEILPNVCVLRYN